MAKLARREAPAMFADLLYWLEWPLTTLLPFTSGQTFRVEDYIQDNRFVIRAELPGLDPDKDIEVTVDDGTLTIHAERREEEEKKPHRSEFRYGSLTRSVRLPAKADAKHVTARYEKGILDVSVPVPEARPEGRRVAIEKAG
jgi:HSP20 family protein